MPEIIQIKNLQRHFKRGDHDVYALRGIDLSIAQGDFVALVGPSGSGKSTLLNALGGLDRPSAGEIWVNDIPLHDADEKFERGRPIDRIAEDLAEATAHFDTALKTTELAKLTLADAITARAGDEEAEAYRDAQRTWGDAEETFERAIAELEDGKLDRARRFGDEATELYAQAQAESGG